MCTHYWTIKNPNTELPSDREETNEEVDDVHHILTYGRACSRSAKLKRVWLCSCLNAALYIVPVALSLWLLGVSGTAAVAIVAAWRSGRV